MHRFFILAFGLWLFGGTAAHAEPLPLEEVIKRALSGSPAVAHVEREYQERLAEGTAAKTLENPELQLDVLRQTKGDRDTDVEVEITQKLRLSQLSGTRRLYAETLARAASTQQKYEMFKLINEVSTLYVKLWLLQERKSLYERSAKEAEAIAGTIRRAAREGQVAPAESTLFTADSLRLRTEIDTIEAGMAQTKVELAKAAGFSFAGIEAVKPEFPAVPSTDVLVRFSDSRSNLRAIVRDNLTATEQRLRLAEEDAFPEFGPRFLYSRGLSGRDDQAIGVGVALRVPLWDTNQAERQRARAALSAAKADADSLAVRQPEELVGQLQQSTARLQERSKKYWGEILPAYRKSYELSRQMLGAGQIPALDLWQVREKLYQIEEAALQSTLDVYAARLRLELEIGGKLEELGNRD